MSSRGRIRSPRWLMKVLRWRGRGIESSRRRFGWRWIMCHLRWERCLGFRLIRGQGLFPPSGIMWRRGSRKTWMILHSFNVIRPCRGCLGRIRWSSRWFCRRFRSICFLLRLYFWSIWSSSRGIVRLGLLVMMWWWIFLFLFRGNWMLWCPMLKGPKRMMCAMSPYAESLEKYMSTTGGERSWLVLVNLLWNLLRHWSNLKTRIWKFYLENLVKMLKRTVNQIFLSNHGKLRGYLLHTIALCCFISSLSPMHTAFISWKNMPLVCYGWSWT